MRLLARRGQRAGKGYSACWQGLVSKRARRGQQIRKESATNRMYSYRFFAMRNLNYLFIPQLSSISAMYFFTPSSSEASGAHGAILEGIIGA